MYHNQVWPSWVNIGISWLVLGVSMSKVNCEVNQPAHTWLAYARAHEVPQVLNPGCLTIASSGWIPAAPAPTVFCDAFPEPSPTDPVQQSVAQSVKDNLLPGHTWLAYSVESEVPTDFPSQCLTTTATPSNTDGWAHQSPTSTIFCDPSPAPGDQAPPENPDSGLTQSNPVPSTGPPTPSQSTGIYTGNPAPDDTSLSSPAEGPTQDPGSTGQTPPHLPMETSTGQPAPTNPNTVVPPLNTPVFSGIPTSSEIPSPPHPTDSTPVPPPAATTTGEPAPTGSTQSEDSAPSDSNSVSPLQTGGSQQTPGAPLSPTADLEGTGTPSAASSTGGPIPTESTPPEDPAPSDPNPVPPSQIPDSSETPVTPVSSTKDPGTTGPPQISTESSSPPTSKPQTFDPSETPTPGSDLSATPVETVIVVTKSDESSTWTEDATTTTNVPVSSTVTPGPDPPEATKRVQSLLDRIRDKKPDIDDFIEDPTDEKADDILEFFKKEKPEIDDILPTLNSEGSDDKGDCKGGDPLSQLFQTVKCQSDKIDEIKPKIEEGKTNQFEDIDSIKPVLTDITEPSNTQNNNNNNDDDDDENTSSKDSSSSDEETSTSSECETSTTENLYVECFTTPAPGRRRQAASDCSTSTETTSGCNISPITTTSGCTDVATVSSCDVICPSTTTVTPTTGPGIAARSEAPSTESCSTTCSTQKACSTEDMSPATTATTTDVKTTTAEDSCATYDIATVTPGGDGPEEPSDEPNLVVEELERIDAGETPTISETPTASETPIPSETPTSERETPKPTPSPTTEPSSTSSTPSSTSSDDDDDEDESTTPAPTSQMIFVLNYRPGDDHDSRWAVFAPEMDDEDPDWCSTDSDAYQGYIQIEETLDRYTDDVPFPNGDGVKFEDYGVDGLEKIPCVYSGTWDDPGELTCLGNAEVQCSSDFDWFDERTKCGDDDDDDDYSDMVPRVRCSWGPEAKRPG